MSKVLVGMSGGVDSSVAAKLLCDAGHTVAGATLKLFSDEDIVECENPTRTCCALSDVQDARSVCRKLGIDHFVYNFREAFAADVIGRFIDSYRQGRTPNPCIDCNRYIKFEKMVERALLLGFDYIATGHYSRIRQDEKTGRYLLLRGLDPTKDQSYVLYALTQFQLSHTLFPLGELQKTEVREIAEKAGLINARKKESQDICFVPGGDYPAFINKAVPGANRPGNFIDSNGKVIGTHQGVTRYTIGQRRGIGASFGPEPLYVVAKNATDNTVTLAPDAALLERSLIADDVNLIALSDLSAPLRVKAKIRYNQSEQSATVTTLGDSRVRVDFDEKQRAVAGGQAVVFYDGDIVIGGATIVGVLAGDKI